MKLFSALSVFAVLVVFPASFYSQMDAGRFKGFAKSHPQEILNEVRQTFVVRDIRGEIRDGDGNPRPGVIFQIRLQSSSRIQGTKTDQSGRFRIKGTPEGTYDFKTTLDGFQSLVGKIQVSKVASPKPRINLTLSLGF
ncbi:MAG: carboxypeptidase-like regulatory domain-containing protein [Candidatus Acidiferrales bacterium]